MAVMLGKTVQIFKFKETGLVELCQEVADYIRMGDYIKDNVDPFSARFVETPDTLIVEFERKK